MTMAMMDADDEDGKNERGGVEVQCRCEVQRGCHALRRHNRHSPINKKGRTQSEQIFVCIHETAQIKYKAWKVGCK